MTKAGPRGSKALPALCQPCFHLRETIPPQENRVPMRQIAHLPTDHAAQYVATMAKHFGHKIAVEITGEAALLRFDAGEGRLVPQPGGIALSGGTAPGISVRRGPCRAVMPGRGRAAIKPCV